MSVEEYLERLQQIAAEHPGATVAGMDDADPIDVEPEWDPWYGLVRVDAMPRHGQIWVHGWHNHPVGEPHTQYCVPAHARSELL